MPTTGSGKWPYPNSSATPDVPADVLLLAQRIDLMGSGWTHTANATTRAALVTNSNAYEGLRVYQIDTGGVYVYRSSAWVLVDLPWTTYVPTISNWSSTSPTTVGRYAIVGGVCHVLVTSKLGTGAITVGNITVSLPVAAVTTGLLADSSYFSGNVSMMDVSAGPQNCGGYVRYVDANTVRVMRESAGGADVRAVTSSTSPFTWATLDEISLMFSYPVA